MRSLSPPNAPHTLTLGLILLLGAISALTPLAIDMYLPAMPDIARDLASSAGDVQKTLAAYTAGFAIGQIVYGPISDSYGRRPVLLFGTCFFLCFSVACALATDISILTIVRVLQGFCGAAAAVVTQALVRDMFNKEEYARMMSFVTLVMTIAPLAAPMLGGYFAVWFGWRSIFWFLTLFSTIVIICIWRAIPETLAQSRRAPLRIGYVLRNCLRILGNRSSLGYMLTSSFSFAGMFSFLTAGSFVYIDFYGISTQTFGFFFGLNIFCLILLTSFNSRFVMRLGSERMLQIGLIIQSIAALCMVVGQLLGLGLWGLVPSMMLFVGTMVLIASNATACVLSKYPDFAGTASSLAGTLRFGTGTVVGALLSQVHSPTPWAMVISIASCGFISAAAYLFLVDRSEA
ncbi:MAG: Bcr/CflA family multidrug efflux MFS transporter [Enterovibrio sp.]